MYATASQAKAPIAASRQEPLIYTKRRSPTRIYSSEPQRAAGQSQNATKLASTDARFGHDFSRVRVFPDARGNTQPRVEGAGGQIAPPEHGAAQPSLAIKRFAVGGPTRHDLAPPGLGSAATPDKSTGEYEEFQDQSSSATTFAKKPDGVHIEVEATGVYSSAEFPDSFKWTQTIDTNVPKGGATSPYVDPRPNDDTKPFYYTDAEQAAHPTTFIDYPKRPAPGAGTTNWDAILSLNGVNETTKTVTAFDSLTYGFSRDTTGAVTTRAPRSTGSATHQSILAAEFPGWTFRRSGLSRGAKTAIGVGGGALVGAGIGAVVGGPVGAAVGAGIGALVGGIGSLFF